MRQQRGRGEVGGGEGKGAGGGEGGGRGSGGRAGRGHGGKAQKKSLRVIVNTAMRDSFLCLSFSRTIGA